MSKPGSWVDWNDPGLRRVADRAFKTIEKVMSGNLSDAPQVPVDPIHVGDTVRVDGPALGVPRIYIGTVQSFTDWGFANIWIEETQDVDQNQDLTNNALIARKVAAGMSLSLGDVEPIQSSQLWEAGDVMSAPVQICKKVE